MIVRRLRSLAALSAVYSMLLVSVPVIAIGAEEEELETLLEDEDSKASKDSPAEDSPAEEAAPSDPAETPAEEAAPAEPEETPAEPAETPAETPEEPAPPAEEPAPAEPADELPPPAEEATPTPPEPTPTVPPRSSRRETPPPREADELPAGGTENVFDRLGLSVEARRNEAAELVKQGRGLMQNGELVKAEMRLAAAAQLDPQNEEARRLLSQVRFDLGDYQGRISETQAWLSDQQIVQREQAKAMIYRFLNEARDNESAQEYGRAVERYEQALDAIRSFHFNLDLDDQRRQAEVGLQRAKDRKKAQDEEERQRYDAMLADQAKNERDTSTRYLENQIRELRRNARAAEDAQDFDRAILYHERILFISPRDEVSLRRVPELKELRHAHNMNRLIRQAAENYELAILSIEESSVIYQQIFRFPSAREWQRISAKTPSIQEEIAASETSVEKEIKRKLEQTVNYEVKDETLPNALKQLQTLVGINFILSKEGAEQAADKQVKLEGLGELKVKALLPLLLASAEGFGYAIREGAIVIGPKASLKEREYLKFYEISDLIQSHPDFPAPNLGLDELQGKASGSGAPLAIDTGGDTPPVPKLESDKLLELIKKELGGGGEGAEAEGISLLSGKLTARTSLENHLKLARLLDQFRKAIGMMVTVESRFLDIQDNFLEEVGVNFGSTGTNFLPNNIPDINGNGTSLSPGWEYVSPSGDYNSRGAVLGNLSQPLGSKVNPFNLSSSGGGAYQINVLKAERYQIEAILTAVAKEQEIKKLSSPRVTAFNGQVSHTLVVTQSAYIQDLEVNQTGVIPVINPVIGVLNSGSILEVRPTVSYDRKYIVLEIQPTLAERLAPEVAQLNLSGNFTVVPIELPVLSVTKIKTTVTVPDGGTVLVGGLKREIRNKTQVGIPGLLDMPILNLLWGRKGESNLRSNLFVLINAKVTIVHEEEARLFGA